ncbi:MAG TPA: DUF5615 family PIN-like protein [Thermoanaerobaculia bacterium]|nr:DUF5615 family PIN-like protein [Thermoanaerobaculia bacterium]
MAKVRLHLDADVSRKDLHQALLDLGHDVTRTPNSWIALDASDERQILAATAQGRCIFTFNSRDFVPLARTYPHHHGILLAAQRSWNFPQLLAGLKHFLAETEEEAMIGQIRWLQRPE